jgi:ABC-type multidrug transport system fused ATPase/permease subunit
MVAIVGKVGSGKSSLFQAILQEIPYIYGKIEICTDKIAFVEQEPYIYPGTIEDNVLFGKEYKQELYEKALKYSCLIDDFKILDKGDKTVVGEKG